MCYGNSVSIFNLRDAGQQSCPFRRHLSRLALFTLVNSSCKILDRHGCGNVIGPLLFDRDTIDIRQNELWEYYLPFLGRYIFTCTEFNRLHAHTFLQALSNIFESLYFMAANRENSVSFFYAGALTWSIWIYLRYKDVQTTTTTQWRPQGETRNPAKFAGYRVGNLRCRKHSLHVSWTGRIWNSRIRIFLIRKKRKIQKFEFYWIFNSIVEEFQQKLTPTFECAEKFVENVGMQLFVCSVFLQ